MLVEVWSDVVCPWCHVGLARFDAAVRQLGWEDDVEVVLRAFELPPRPPGWRPPGGGATVARLDAAAEQLGLRFEWSTMRRTSTFDAHRLAAWALTTAGAQAQLRLERRLMHGYFAEGMAPDDHAALAALAADVGLDGADAASVLASDAFDADVRAAEAEAEALDIHGVPSFRFERTLIVPGAQETETFVSLLARARERLANR